MDWECKDTNITVENHRGDSFYSLLVVLNTYFP